MSSFADLLRLIGIQTKSPTKLLLKEISKSREALVETITAVSESTDQICIDQGIERRRNPDCTCQGERRRSHLRGVWNINGGWQQ